MARYWKYILLIALGLYLAVKSFVSFYGAKPGNQAPDFESTLIDSTPFKLSNLKGKYILLDFWGSWCGPCRKEIPELIKLYRKHQNNFVVVSVALEKNDKNWIKVSQQYGFEWKHQIVDINQFVLMSEIGRTYGVSEIPAKFLISPEFEILPQKSFNEIDSVLSRL